MPLQMTVQPSIDYEYGGYGQGQVNYSRTFILPSPTVMAFPALPAAAPQALAALLMRLFVAIAFLLPLETQCVPFAPWAPRAPHCGNRGRQHAIDQHRRHRCNHVTLLAQAG